MESELKSLQSKIMDLENKFSFTHHEESQLDEFHLDVHGDDGGIKVFESISIPIDVTKKKRD